MAGVLPGLGAGMVRGPPAGPALGQVVVLPGICTSGPLALPDVGPGPGRWVKHTEPTDPTPGCAESNPLPSPRLGLTLTVRARPPLARFWPSAMCLYAAWSLAGPRRPSRERAG